MELVAVLRCGRRLVPHAAGVVSLLLAGAVQAACPRVLDHRVPDLMTDRPTDLCQYAGRVVVAVNTASRCGFTPQYAGLEQLYRKYRDRGLIVLGFPANDFGAQEPGSNREIAQFCQANYGVSFPMLTKVHVVGPNAHPFYVELARRTGSAPSWNFHKYVVDRRGEVVSAFASRVEPGDRQFVALIERLLAEAPPRP